MSVQFSTTDRVRLDQHSRLQRQLLLLLDVVTDVAQLLLHHPHRLKVRRVVEGVTSQQQQLVNRQTVWCVKNKYTSVSVYLTNGDTSSQQEIHVQRGGDGSVMKLVWHPGRKLIIKWNISSVQILFCLFEQDTVWLTNGAILWPKDVSFNMKPASLIDWLIVYENKQKELHPHFIPLAMQCISTSFRQTQWWVKRWRCSWYLDEVACDVPPCDVEASGQVGQGEALVHRTDVCDAITGVNHHSSQQSWNKKDLQTRTKWDSLAEIRCYRRNSTLSVESEDGLDGDINSWELICFKHHLGTEEQGFSSLHYIYTYSLRPAEILDHQLVTRSVRQIRFFSSLNMLNIHSLITD